MSGASFLSVCVRNMGGVGGGAAVEERFPLLGPSRGTERETLLFDVVYVSTEGVH